MQLSWCFSQSSLTGIKRPFITTALGPQLCTVWLTHDRWLLYGGRHRWTRSLNLPLYRASPPPPQRPPFLIISTLSYLYMCVGVWNLFIFIHAFSARFAPALNIQFLSNSGMKKPLALFAANVRTGSFQCTSACTPFGRAHPRRRGGLSALLISTCVSQRSADESGRIGTRTGSSWEGEEGDYWGPASQKVTQGEDGW